MATAVIINPVILVYIAHFSMQTCRETNTLRKIFRDNLVRKFFVRDHFAI